MHKSSRLVAAFTLIELFVVVGTLALLATMLVPALARTKNRAQRIDCANNLKQVGLAMRAWALSYQDQYPMTVPNANGGASGDIGVRSIQNNSVWPTGSKGAFAVYQSLSNYLSGPQLTFCPAEFEIGRTKATSFAMQLLPNYIPYTNDLNCSYFVGVDATDSKPQMFLAGDHNMGSGGPAGGPPFGAFVTYFNSLGSNFPPNNASVGWTAQQHLTQGNVVLGDGSVQQFNRAQLQQALFQSGDPGQQAGVFISPANCSPAGINRLQFP